MKAKGKSSNTPHPVWIYGDYITTPPQSPSKMIRPQGHYIDKGGYPGANVYAVNIDTLCKQVPLVDQLKKTVYENDILLRDTKHRITYLIIQDTETAVDIISGEILNIEMLRAEDIRVIGNLIDDYEFIEGIRYHIENDLDVPYLPALNIVGTSLPFLKMTCLKCGHVTLGCRYTARHADCGGYFTTDFASKIYKKGASA